MSGAVVLQLVSSTEGKDGKQRSLKEKNLKVNLHKRGKRLIIFRLWFSFASILSYEWTIFIHSLCEKREKRVVNVKIINQMSKKQSKKQNDNRRIITLHINI